MNRVGRGTAAAVVAGLTVTGLVGGFATGASAQVLQPADSVGQCAGLLWGVAQQDVCVLVRTGAKNASNHTEWVSSMTVENLQGGPGMLEGWAGNVFYKQTNSTKQLSATWTVNRWIASGSGICAALQPYYPTDRREVACITIKV